MEQQACILRSILTQLEKREIVDTEAPECIAGEFARLKNQSMKYRTDKNYPSKVAEKQENIKKNRYKDIVPFDHSRVKLSFTTAKTDTDYINASFIKGVSGARAYIATQGPLPHTVVDFLRMIWEYNIKVIVMACREFEMGKKKCEIYWPNKQETFVCEPFKVNCDSEDEKGDYLTRTLRVTYRNSSRTLKQLHYVNWPDHGVPDSIPPILDLLHEMRHYQAHEDIPICIHCSAGCGRTGALCAIDYTWNLLRNQMITSDFSIYNLVQDMRTQRPSVVQTKEQYLLVYRTIKVLFQRYLAAMDAQTYQNAVTVAPSALSEGELSDASEELDLMSQEQHLLDEDRHVLLQYHAPMASASDYLSALSAKDMQWSQLQCQPLQPPPVALTTTRGLKYEEANMSPELVKTSHRVPAVEDDIQECLDIPALNHPPPPAVVEAVCLMVEDPYFDTLMSSVSEATLEPEDDSNWTISPIFTTPSLLLNDETLELTLPTSDTKEVPTNEEMPPPLPERTPESYVLAVDAELSDICERLAVIHPSNADTETVGESAGSPPSPAPPLPERTPESYELAVDPAPVEQPVEVTPPLNLDIIGMSSEWFGNSTPAATARQNDKRSKSLRREMRFSAPAIQFDFKPSLTSNHDYHFPLEPSAPPLLPSEDSLTPPLPDRNPDSLLIPGDALQSNSWSSHPLGTTQPTPRVGVSSEWDGTTQSKSLLDVVKRRSKSVRAKSSKQEPRTVFQPSSPIPVVAAEGGSVESNSANPGPSLNADKSRNKSDKNEKGMSRSKSLKFFKKQKAKTAPPPPPTQAGGPAQSLNPSFMGFKFGFGNRFGKPKGPRTYPETWV